MYQIFSINFKIAANDSNLKCPHTTVKKLFNDEKSRSFFKAL